MEQVVEIEMKEYEKLAEEWCSQFETKNSGRDAFRAGFIKARELACDYMDDRGESYFALDELGEKEIYDQTPSTPETKN